MKICVSKNPMTSSEECKSICTNQAICTLRRKQEKFRAPILKNCPLPLRGHLTEIMCLKAIKVKN